MILGLTLPKLIGAIVMGMILSCVMVMIFSPHEDNTVEINEPTKLIETQPDDESYMKEQLISGIIAMIPLAIVIFVLTFVMGLFNVEPYGRRL